MNSNRTIIYIGLLLATFFLLAVSCRRESLPGVKARGNGNGAALLIRAKIADGISLSSDTKEAYSGGTFTTGQSFGICVCVHEDSAHLFDPYFPGYGNLEAICKNDTGDSFEFYNPYIKATSSQLFLTSRSDSACADIYAYAPYIDNVVNPRAINVDFTKNQDVMRAVQNGVSNRNLDPFVGDTIPVTLSFVHLLSRLRFGFILENAGSNHLLDSITIKKTGSKSTSLYSSGTFNCLVDSSGITNLVAADSVRVIYGGTDIRYGSYDFFSSATSYTWFDFVLYPTQLQNDDDLTIVFSIDGFPHEYSIKRSDVLHSDGTTCGFQANYSYDFHFKFDNYVHLQGITVQQGRNQGTFEDTI